MAEVKRGYRKLTVIVPVAVYDHLKAQAEDNDREIGQQAAYLLRKVVMETTNAALTRALGKPTAAELIPEALENGVVVDWMAPTEGPNKDGVEPVVVE